MKVKATWLATEQSVAPTVTSKWSKGYGGPSSGAEWANMAIECEFQFYENHPQDSRITEQTLCPTVTGRWGTGGGNIPLVLGSAQPNASITKDGTCPTLTAQMGTGGNNTPLVVMNPHEYSSFKKEDVIGTITTQIGKGVTGSQPLVLMDQGGGVMTVEENIVGTLRAQTHGHEPVVLQHEIYPLKLANALRTNDKPDGGCGVGNDGEPMFTLTTSCSSCGIAEIEAYRISSEASNVMRSSNPNTGFKKTDISPTIDTVDPSPSKGQGGIAVVHAVYENQRSELRLNEKMNPLTTPSGKPGQGLPLVLVEQETKPHCFKVRTGCEGGGKGYLGSDDKSFTLATNNDQYLMTAETYCLAENTIGRQPENGGNGSGFQKDLSYTLNATGVHGVMTNEEKVIATALTTNDPSRGPRSAEVTAQVEAVYKTEARVRKLTPVECERLQGFPDNWTRIPYRGKDEENCPDSPRYKAVGNSWCVPCVMWIGQRIAKELEECQKRLK